MKCQSYHDYEVEIVGEEGSNKRGLHVNVAQVDPSLHSVLPLQMPADCYLRHPST